MEPQQLGPYRVVRTLGRGGMGAVYAAVHLETDEPAALKVLSPMLAEEPDFRQRFEAEIETLKRLYHPNIVQLFGFGEQDGQLFYAMELVDGVSLDDELGQGRVFHWRQVAEIGIETCRALRHAHDRGITHRDIKPANLLWTRDRRIKLSDFGIAKLFGNTRLTATGNVLGTAEFMAPEQADGRPTGPRSDLYSLGCVFYCLLARRPPFRSRSLLEMLDKHRSAIPEPISQHVSGLPPEMDSLIAQLLEKDLEKRPPNPTLVARRLESMLKGGAPALDAPAKRPAPRSEQEFDLSPPDAPPGIPAGKHLPETRMAEESARAAAVPPGVTRPADQLPETKATSAFQAFERDGEPGALTGLAGQTQRQTTGRFIPVDREELGRTEPEPPPRPALISIQTWVLAASLTGIGLGAYYLLRPPTADALYDKINAATGDKKIDSLLAAKPRIEEFLTRFSDDSRAGQLRLYMREIELHNLERRFALRAKGMADTEGLLPVERAYVEAINQAWLNPDRGARLLQALVDLHQDRTDPSGPDGQCLELARRQLERLRQQLARSSVESLAEIEDRLQRADELSKTNPEVARSILQALVELYEEKSWAADAVRLARQRLAALKPSGPNAETPLKPKGLSSGASPTDAK